MDQPRFQRWAHNRLFLLILMCGVYAFYFPIGQYASTLPDHDISVSLDNSIQMTPGWIYIYAMIYLIGFVPFAVVRQPRIFLAAVKAFLLMMVIAYVVFMSFPVLAMHRPDDFIVDSFATWGLRLCYFVDTPANCFPSLHVAVSFLAAFATIKVDRLVGAFTFALAMSIALSTMMVKQHFFADVAFGFALADLARRIFLQPLRLRADELIDKTPGRRGALLVLLVYSLCILGMYITYLSGWMPWR